MIALFSVLTFFPSFFSCLLSINHNRNWLLWFPSMVLVYMLPINLCLVKHCAAKSPNCWYRLSPKIQNDGAENFLVLYALTLWWASGTLKWNLKLSKADCRHPRETEESALERKKNPSRKIILKSFEIFRFILCSLNTAAWALSPWLLLMTVPLLFLVFFARLVRHFCWRPQKSSVPHD